MELPNQGEVVWGEWKVSPATGILYRIGVKTFVDPREPHIVHQHAYLQTKYKVEEP